MINSVLIFFYKNLQQEERREFIVWLSVLFGGTHEFWESRCNGSSQFDVDERTEIRLTKFMIMWKAMIESNALKLSS